LSKSLYPTYLTYIKTIRNRIDVFVRKDSVSNLNNPYEILIIQFIYNLISNELIFQLSELQESMKIS